MFRKHGSRLIIVDKLETVEKDKLLHNLIKDEYKDIFNDIIIINPTEITKENFYYKLCGKCISSIEFRTFITYEKYRILLENCSPSMSATKNLYLEKIKDNETKGD